MSSMNENIKDSILYIPDSDDANSAPQKKIRLLQEPARHTKRKVGPKEATKKADETLNEENSPQSKTNAKEAGTSVVETEQNRSTKATSAQAVQNGPAAVSETSLDENCAAMYAMVLTQKFASERKALELAVLVEKRNSGCESNLLEARMIAAMAALETNLKTDFESALRDANERTKQECMRFVQDTLRHSGGGSGNFRDGYDEYRGGGSGNFRGWSGNFRGGSDNFRGGSDDFRGGSDGFRGGWSGNFRGGSDEYLGRGSGNVRGEGSGNFRGGSDYFHGGGSGNFRGGFDNFRGGGSGENRGSSDDFRGGGFGEHVRESKNVGGQSLGEEPGEASTEKGNHGLLDRNV